MRVLFVEPPKDYWFVMGEYLPPPTACIQLAAYLESKHPEYEIDVVDCQAERLDWGGLEKRIASKGIGRELAGVEDDAAVGTGGAAV